MSLPGKLCIGILEEDNPLRSYFRFKPLLIEQNGRYVPYEHPEDYPREGAIRIVPDKNESFHFKTRMRQMGLFCVVDLRSHPDDNDKIRPNKNYRDDSPEQNAYILYSDVVLEPAPHTIFQILPQAQRDAIIPPPRTAHVLLMGEELRPERYAWETLSEERAQLMPTDKVCDMDRLQHFDLEGFRGERLTFAILPPEKAETPAPRPAPVEAPAPAAPVHTAPEAPAPAVRPAPEAPEAPEAPAEDPGRPWIHHDATIAPRQPDPHMSRAQRNLAAQSGLNPRRGRSLQELIDEKWQRSRMNQLGQPIAPIQTGTPLESPVAGAVRAVESVWDQPQLRRELLDRLQEIDEFGPSLQERREAARRSGIERHLEDLEARRLALMGELEHLDLKNADVRAGLTRQLRQQAEGELAEALQKAEDAKAESEKYRQMAEASRAAAADAQKALDSMTGEALEQHLTHFALDEHMLERMRLIRRQADAVPPAAPSLQQMSLDALAVRVMNCFDVSGFAISRIQALELCAAAAVSPVLILSGPVGIGKTRTARLLAHALGWDSIDRVAVFEPGRPVKHSDPRLKALRQLPDTPALLLLDDANLCPAADPLYGLDTLLPPQWRMILTVQDAGQPLSARTLDRGFTLRLTPKEGSPWRPFPSAPSAPEAPASLSLDVPETPLPAVAEARMDALRTALARHGAAFSRRALDDAWRCCALMLQALGENADPIPVVDRVVAHRLLPPLLAEGPLTALAALPALLEGLPMSRALLTQSLPVEM